MVIMKKKTWEKHANPWSGITRIATYPFIFWALWYHNWIGLGAIVVWVIINPKVFPKPKNFKHIVINNFAHDSVGGQPTAAFNIDIPKVAKANGYLDAFSASTKDEIVKAMNKIKTMDGPVLLEIKVNKGARKDLGRPTRTPIENKEDFMMFVKT